MTELDIYYGSKNEVEKNLSNFAHHCFVFDDWHCYSLESVLQALKTPTLIVQKRICQMDPKKVHKLYKKAHDKDWQRNQRLHWQGERFDRCSTTYYRLITRIFDAAFAQSESYRAALQSSVGYELQHSIGKHNPSQTVLTVAEFLNQVYRLRSNLI